MKPNTYLLGFGGLLAFLTVSHFFVIVKYFQLLIHDTIYYCQAIAKALYIQLPEDLSRVYVGVLILAVVYTLIKIGVAVFKIYAFNKTLVKTAIHGTKVLDEISSKLGLINKVTILDLDKPQAFCFGILKPRIYLSSGLVAIMNDKELEVILRHEKYHLDHKDTLSFLIATLVESLFPFFPVISDFIRVYRTDREVQADTAAVNGQEATRSLLGVLKKLLQYEPRGTAFIAGIISEDALEARIHSLLMLKTVYKKVSIRNALLSFVSLGALIGLIVSPVQAIELHDQGRDVVMVCNRYPPANFSSQN